MTSKNVRWLPWWLPGNRSAGTTRRVVRLSKMAAEARAMRGIADLDAIGETASPRVQTEKAEATEAYDIWNFRNTPQRKALHLQRLRSRTYQVGGSTLLGFGVWSATIVHEAIAGSAPVASAAYWVGWLVEPLLLSIVAYIIWLRSQLAQFGQRLGLGAMLMEMATLSLSVAICLSVALETTSLGGFVSKMLGPTMTLVISMLMANAERRFAKVAKVLTDDLRVHELAEAEAREHERERAREQNGEVFTSAVNTGVNALFTRIGLRREHPVNGHVNTPVNGHQAGVNVHQPVNGAHDDATDPDWSREQLAQLESLFTNNPREQITTDPVNVHQTAVNAPREQSTTVHDTSLNGVHGGVHGGVQGSAHDDLVNTQDPAVNTAKEEVRKSLEVATEEARRLYINRADIPSQRTIAKDTGVSVGTANKIANLLKDERAAAQ